VSQGPWISDSHKAIIKLHPFIAKLDESNLDQLLEKGFLADFKEDDVIVREGDPIEAIYIILSGRVEVAKMCQTRDGHRELIPDLILTTSDAIGLSESNLFSHTGARTATLTALTDVSLIGWPIELFTDFVKTSMPLGFALKQSWEAIKMKKFIEKVSLFTEFTPEQISRFVEKIEKLEVAAGTMIFHEGDPGEDCYLIKKGKVEISIKGQGQRQEKKIILESSMIFGELALISDSVRSASAQMVEEGTLLVINKNLFKELLQAHSSVTESIVSLAMERTHPKQAAQVITYQRISSEGEELTILKHSKLKKYYQLSPIGLFIWQRINGNVSIEDLITQVLEEFGPVAVNNAYNIIFDLWELGFVYFPSLVPLFSAQPEKSLAMGERSKVSKIRRRLKKILVLKKLYPDIDAVITKSYDRYIKHAFTRGGKVLIFSIIGMGLLILPFFLHNVITSGESIEYPLLILAAIFITNLLLVILHELAHAFTTKSFGREVHSAGLIFNWISLFAYVDTSDMWLSNKKARITVDMAGPFMDMLLAAMATLLGFMAGDANVAYYFCGLALLLYYDVIGNLTPMDENDGYHALSSYTRKPKLMASSVDFLRELPKASFKRHFIQMHRPEVMYWGACLLGLCANILIVFVGQFMLQKILPSTLMGISTWHLCWLLPLFVIIFFAWKVSMQLKR
jgi:CRP-like cAMP-binding protein